jgi:hypothetical protein
LCKSVCAQKVSACESVSVKASVCQSVCV